MRHFFVANELLNDPKALQERMKQDGYLFIRGLFNPEKIREINRQLLQGLSDAGLIQEGSKLEEGKVIPLRQVDQKVFTELQHKAYSLEEAHELWHSSDILQVMEKLIGTEHEIFTHPHKHVRMMFPADVGFKVQQTTPHQDFLYNQGSPEMYSVWTALRDLTPEHGVLEVAEGSHLHGVLGIEKDRVDGSITYTIPEKDIKGDWLTSDFKMGDAIIFHSHTVHRVPPNLTEEIRLSSDCRLQNIAEPISEKWNNLLPGVEEAYPQWKNKELQYYFKKAKLNFKEYDEKNSHILFK